jgi:hypothetical protein
MGTLVPSERVSLTARMVKGAKDSKLVMRGVLLTRIAKFAMWSAKPKVIFDLREQSTGLLSCSLRVGAQT